LAQLKSHGDWMPKLTFSITGFATYQFQNLRARMKAAMEV
jgi:hypothetical protein